MSIGRSDADRSDGERSDAERSGAERASVGRNFLALGLGDAFARLVGFAATVYLARTLGAALYGVVGFATAVVIYLARIADGGIELGLGVREVASGRHALDHLVPSVTVARLLVGGALAVAMLALGALVPAQPDGVVLGLYCLTLLTIAASSRWVYLGLERNGRLSAARTLGELTMVGLVFLLVRDAGDVARAPLAVLAGDLVAATLLFVWLARDGVRLPVRLDLDIVRPLVPRAVPLVLSALLGLMIYNADLIFLRFLRGPSEVGWYSAAYTLIAFLSNVGTAYSMSLLPALTRLGSAAHDRAARDATYHTAVAHVFAAGLPVAIGGTLLASGIIGLVFGAGYAESATPLAILVWSVPLALLRDVPIMALIAHGREDSVLRVTAWAAALNLALNTVLIPPFGMAGAASATVLTEAVRMVVALVYVRREGHAVTGPGRFWRAAVAGGAMAALLVVVRPGEVWLAVLLGAVGYVGALVVVGGVRVRRGGWPELAV